MNIPLNEKLDQLRQELEEGLNLDAHKAGMAVQSAISTLGSTEKALKSAMELLQEVMKGVSKVDSHDSHAVLRTLEDVEESITLDLRKLDRLKPTLDRIVADLDAEMRK